MLPELGECLEEIISNLGWLRSRRLVPEKHQAAYFDLSYLHTLEGRVNLKTRKSNFLLLSLSVGYLEEIRDVNQNFSLKKDFG